MAVIQSGLDTTVLTVDPTSKAARVSIYGADGSVIGVVDKSAIALGVQPGLLNAGADGKLARLVQVGSGGAIKVEDSDLFLYDAVEGAAYDSNKWIQTATTQTITQAVATGTLYNASAITTLNTGIQLVSNRTFPRVLRSPLLFRSKQRHTAHFTNHLIETGFGAPATAITVSAGQGAFWRKDGAGQYVPVISVGSSEILGTPISNATFIASVAATDYAWFEVIIYDDRVQFTILTQDGVKVNEQVIYLAGTSVSNLNATHLQAFTRSYQLTAPASAVQIYVYGTAVYQLYSPNTRTSRESQSGMGYSSIQSPTAYTQLANYGNSTAPTARTLANTTAGEATLGGLIRANAMAAGPATDLILFAFLVPAPYTFYFTGIQIPAPINEVAAVATTATVFQYGMAFGSSAVSLATAGTYPPMRVGLAGFHTAPVALAVGGIFSGNTIDWRPGAPIAVAGGRYVHVIVKCPVGTATATETFQWSIPIDGWFE